VYPPWLPSSFYKVGPIWKTVPIHRDAPDTVMQKPDTGYPVGWDTGYPVRWDTGFPVRPDIWL
jgi:hypothetical protein